MTLESMALTCIGSSLLAVLIMFVSMNLSRLAAWALSVYRSGL